MARKPREHHGLSQHPLYKTWQGMLQRCYNPKCNLYKWYGARGVTVCQEWRDSVKAFVDWSLANGWVHGLELDKDTKVPGNTIYGPNTCVYITHRENMIVHVGRDSGRRTQRLKLSHSELAELIRRRTSGEKSSVLALEYGVSHGYVNALYRQSKQ